MTSLSAAFQDINLSTGPKPFIFVLMPFASSFSDIYKFGIKGAAEEIGAYAERVDEQIYDEGILERIFNQISKADVIVADLTDRNANVFYEVGYAHALNKIVILLTQQSNDIPFDLQHRPHIVYEGKIDKLRSDLIPRLTWALEESRKRNTKSDLFYRFSVSIQQVDLPEMAFNAEPPIIERPRKASKITFDVRNEGVEISEQISHIYLLGTKTTLVPASKTRNDVLERMRVASSDKETIGMTRQYRIPITLPPIPPGAVEQVPLFIKLEEVVSSTWPNSAKFYLRLHTKVRSFNFPFILSFAVS